MLASAACMAGIPSLLMIKSEVIEGRQCCAIMPSAQVTRLVQF